MKRLFFSNPTFINKTSSTLRLPSKLNLLAAGILLSTNTWAQHEHPAHLDEIIVTGAQNKSRAETALPVSVLSGEMLRKEAASTIGETINNEPGVVSSSFGSGVGQPVIRGLEGNRVLVLENNLATLDASGASPDHASAVEALLADRIEIVRGPATLLYGNGAIGGVVNVLDNRIPTTLADSITGGVEVRGNSVDDGKAVVGKITGSAGQFSWYGDGLYRETNNVRIPDYAIDEHALHHDDEEGEEEEPIENTRGFVGNSNTEAHAVTIGGSYIGDQFFIGLAYRELENNYGLPPGAHAHGHEEEEEEEEEHEEETPIRLDVEQQQTDIKAGLTLNGFINQLGVDLRFNDYQHTELEGEEPGTTFTNKGVETRLTANHGSTDNGISGVWGLHLADSTFEASGDEAFIPKTDVNSVGIFAIETLRRNNFIYELGLRVEQFELAPDAACDAKDTSWSASGSAIWQWHPAANMHLSIGRAERAPTVEERYSNINTSDCSQSTEPVEHLATARLEFGNPNLDTEVSNNIEVGVQKFVGSLQLEANVFYNRFKDYIYLADLEEIDEEIFSYYLQDDADFYGLESKVRMPLVDTDLHHLDITLLADYVYAELDNGDYVARLPPARVGVSLDYLWGEWAINLRATHHTAQTKLAPDEDETDGYTRLDAAVDYHLPLGNQELLIFLKGNNLSDEEIRDHTSYMKNFAPAPGRGVELGLRYTF